jgi:hypothetical protein
MRPSTAPPITVSEVTADSRAITEDLPLAL